MKQTNLGKVITEQVYRFQFEKMTLWEEHLRLHLKPKPKWCPVFVWKWLVKKMLYQTTKVEKKSELV
jgi:hypothetical protein